MRRRTTRPDRTATGAIGVVLCVFWMALVSPARAAEALLSPSIDGHLGAWLLAAPLGPGAARKPHLPTVGHGPLRYRPVAHSDGALDLRAVLGKAARPGTRAVLGGVLRVPETVDALLLVGADGPLGVLVDGKVVHERKQAHLRGQAWDVVPLRLEAGDHPVVLELRYRLPHFAVAVRLLDARDLTAPAGVRLVLPGVTEAHQKRLQRALVDVRIAQDGTGDGFAPTIRVGTKRGLLETERSASVTVEGSDGPVKLDAGLVPIGPRGAAGMTIRIADVAKDAPVRVRAQVGPVLETRRFLPWTETGQALSLTRRARGKLPTMPKASRPILEGTLAYLSSSLEDWDERDIENFQRRREALTRLSKGILDGSDPLDTESGVLELAIRSPLDGEPHPFLLHVPAGSGASQDERRPLVVALHGYRGSPEGIMTAFLDQPGRTVHRRVDGFVLAPEAFGDAFYRGPGEASVLQALGAVKARYPVDDNRVSITGVSMGGTGTAHIAFRYADRFSKAAPLAGYHSYFVRRDTQGKSTLPWEEARMRHWSPASWAGRGRSLPLYVAHGTRDYPLVNSRVLCDRYRELGYDLVAEWPDTGHSVWRVVYNDARMWPALSTARRTRPSHVTIVTDSLRYGRLHWAAITGLESRTSMAALDAQERTDGSVIVHTDNVTALRLDARPNKTTVSIDGKSLAFEANRPIAAHGGKKGWKAGTPPERPGHKRSALEGPIRDVFLHPVVFVYGALDPAARRANREVAEIFATRYTGSARYPVVADTQATPDLLRGRSWFLVGSPRSHSILRRLGRRLPIVVDEGAVVSGAASYRGADIGALFIHPNPEQPGEYVVVLTAPEPAGIWRALSLPKLLPDYVIYDDRVALATAEQILGDAPLIDSGFFGDDWSLAPRPASDSSGAPSASSGAPSASASASAPSEAASP